jgi:hypothetical protein
MVLKKTLLNNLDRKEDLTSETVQGSKKSTSESVQSSDLSLQCIDDIDGCDCLSLGVLGVCDSIADNIQHTRFFVDHARDRLTPPRLAKCEWRALWCLGCYREAPKIFKALPPLPQPVILINWARDSPQKLGRVKIDWSNSATMITIRPAAFHAIQFFADRPFLQ